MESKLTLADTLVKFLGQQVAVVCSRYHYRGVLVEVNADHLVLAQATSVEVSGPSQRDAPMNEDPIGSSIVVLYEAIELVHQSNWVFAPLPSAPTRS